MEDVRVSLSSTNQIEDVFFSIMLSIILGNWQDFEALCKKMKDLKPSQEILDDFGTKQMKIIAATGAKKIIAMREKLTILGVSQKALDCGYNSGFQELCTDTKNLNLSQKMLNDFGKRQMKIATITGSYTIISIYKKLIEIGVSEEAIMKGYEMGYQIFKPQFQNVPILKKT